MTSASILTSRVLLRSFLPADALPFRELNEAWITQLFTLEDPDRLVLGDPLGQIIAPGGHIVMALLDGQPAGCCALLPMDPGEYELAKMCVAEHARGHGLGRQILLYTIDHAPSGFILKPARSSPTRSTSTNPSASATFPRNASSRPPTPAPMFTWSDPYNLMLLKRRTS